MKLGYIATIDEEKLKFKATLYVMDYVPKGDEKQLQQRILKMSFDSVIDSMVQRYTDNDVVKDIFTENEEIENFFNQYGEDDKPRLIILPETGVSGGDRYDFSNSSILYVEIRPELYIGFIVNKMLLKIIVGGHHVDWIE